MLAVALVYTGFVCLALGAVSLVKPLSFIGIQTRGHGVMLLGAGVLLVGAGWLLPAREVRIASPRTQLDHFAPVYQFNEIHTIRVNAPKDRVYRAIKSTTADEILLFRTLTWIRRLGQPGPESILNAPDKMPILEVATRSGFLLLSEEPEREIVLGTAVMAPPGWQPKREPTPADFKAVRDPGFVLAAMNFLVEDAGAGASTVTTETRVFATDPSSARRFARYWRVIYPGSALIRRMWLRAVKLRAEATGP